MPSASNVSADVDIDIRGLLGSIARRKWFLALLTIVTAVLFFVLFSLMPERFQSTGSILLEQRESVFTRSLGEGQLTANSRIDIGIVGTQVEILKSDDLSLEVIRELNLVNDAEFATKNSFAFLDNLLNIFKSPAQNSASSAKSVSADGFVEPTAQEVEILDKFIKRLTIFGTPNSHVIFIKYWSHRKELARDVVNLIAEKYLERNKSARSISTNEAADWLGPVIQDLQTKLTASEAAMEEFRASNDLFTGANNTSLATQQLSDISTELSRVRSQRSSAEAKAASIRSALKSGASIDAIPEVIASGFIQRLQERVAGIEADITQLSTSLLPNHPRIKAAQSQLVGYKKQIKTAANNILKSLENDVNLRRSQENELVQNINRLKSEASRVGEKAVQLRQLERKVVSNRDALQRYQNQFIQANSRASNDYNPVDAVINQRGKIAFKSHFPKVIPFTIAGSLSVLLLSIIGILAIELLSGRAFKPVDRTVYAPVEPEQAAPVQQAAHIGDVHVETPHVEALSKQTHVVDVQDELIEPSDVKVYGQEPQVEQVEMSEEQITQAAGSANAVNRISNRLNPTSANMSSSFDMGQQAPIVPAKADLMRDESSNEPIGVSLNVAQNAALGLDHASIAVVSPGGDEGSKVVLNLARTLANNNKNVIVIDLTGTNATLSKMIGSVSGAGLGEFLTGQVELDKAVLKDNYSNAKILGSGNLTNETLTHNLDNLKNLAKSLAQVNDYVIFDCGPIGVNGLSKIATNDTVVFIPTLGADIQDCLALEQSLIQNGFDEALVINCSASEMQELELAQSA
ncbi:MAG: exopolysaccharide transport family protein [Nitratireductor sp.]